MTHLKIKFISWLVMRLYYLRHRIAVIEWNLEEIHRRWEQERAIQLQKQSVGRR